MAITGLGMDLDVTAGIAIIRAMNPIAIVETGIIRIIIMAMDQ